MKFLDDPEKSQVVRDAWQRMLDATKDDIRTTVPVFGMQNGEFIHDRTGVLFQIADKYFLVTASHHLREMAAHSVPLFFSAEGPGLPAIPLGGRLIGTEPKVIDIAVLDLFQSTVDKLLPARRFLRMSDLDLRGKPDEALYLAMGYPVDYTRREPTAIRTRLLQYLAYLYEGNAPLDSDYPYDPKVHLLLRHFRDGHNTEGSPVTCPNAGGMSGCGIWRLTELKPGWPTNWQAGDRKLVAIQLSYRPGDFLKGTWIKYPLQLIAQHYPGLRRAMTLHL